MKHTSEALKPCPFCGGEADEIISLDTVMNTRLFVVDCPRSLGRR